MNTKVIKSEKGSITLFVLIAMLFLLITAMSVYVNNRNAKNSQDKEIDKIIEQYDETDKIDEIYESMI